MANQFFNGPAPQQADFDTLNSKITAQITTNPNAIYSKQEISKVGRICLINLQLYFNSLPTVNTGYVVGTIPQEFRPSEEIELNMCGTGSDWVETDLANLYIKPNGELVLIPRRVASTNWYKIYTTYFL